MAGIILRNVRKVYPGNIAAVKNCNLEITDKEFVVLVGPSGCGKSTLLRMIAGLEEITEGELYIGARLMNDVLPKDRDIAMVFQNYALYPHMTVYRNMAFGLELRKLSKDEIERRVREVSRILDIDRFLDRRPKALSGGQRQRVALGRAMVRNPAAFLLDEPLSNLDAKLRASMRTELIRLHRRLGATFVYVTHDQIEAMTMGDRIVVMKDGVIQQISTPQNLYDNPCNAFVAGFIGSPQMNFVDSVLEKDEKGCRFRVGNTEIYPAKERISEKVMDYIGEKVRIGFRPEDIHGDVDFLSANPTTVLDASVEVAELMGHEIHLYLNADGIRITARMPPHASFRAGDRVRVAIDAHKIHLFDVHGEAIGGARP